MQAWTKSTYLAKYLRLYCWCDINSMWSLCDTCQVYANQKIDAIIPQPTGKISWANSQHCPDISPDIRTILNYITHYKKAWLSINTYAVDRCWWVEFCDFQWQFHKSVLCWLQCYKKVLFSESITYLIICTTNCKSI